MVVLVIRAAAAEVQLTASGAIPRLGISVWVPRWPSCWEAWLVAAVLFAVDLHRAWGHIDMLLAGCFAARAAGSGRLRRVLQAGLAVLTGWTLVALGALGCPVFAAWRRSRITPDANAGRHSWPPAVPLVVPRIAGRGCPAPKRVRLAGRPAPS